MESTKTFLCRALNPVKKQPPQMCIDAKTISMDTFQTKLFLFWDGRPAALAYVKEILPALLDSTIKPDDILKLYHELNGSLKGGWLEFDFGTKILYLASLKKSHS